MGTYVSGKMLNTKPIFDNSGQLHNYALIFVIQCIAYLLILIWTVFMINEEEDIINFENKFNKTIDSNGGESHINKRLKQMHDNKHIHPIKLLFNFKNIRDMWRTCIKKRTNYVRLQIWLLFISMVCFVLSHSGPIFFLYQFAQKEYHWNAEQYSNAFAIEKVVSALATLILMPLFVRVS